MKELVYTEHHAGTFENGLQVCIYCGQVLADYTGSWASTDPDYLPKGWKEGPLYLQGKNPTMITTDRPLENYGGGDPYCRKVVLCTDGA